MNSNTEIRKITPGLMFGLVQILEISNSWKKLMEIIPKNLDLPDSENKYTCEDVKLVERHSETYRRQAAEIFLEEWGISGKNRPKIRHLLQFLKKAQLYRAADFVAEKILNEPLPERPLDGPAAVIQINDNLTSSEVKDIENILNNISYNTSMYNGNSTSKNFNNNNSESENNFSIPKIIVNSPNDSTNDVDNNAIQNGYSNSNSTSSSSSQEESSDISNRSTGNIPEFSQIYEPGSTDTDSNNIPRVIIDSNSNDITNSSTNFIPNINSLLDLKLNDRNNSAVSSSEEIPNVPELSILLLQNTDGNCSETYEPNNLSDSVPPISILLKSDSNIIETTTSSSNNESNDDSNSILLPTLLPGQSESEILISNSNVPEQSDILTSNSNRKISDVSNGSLQVKETISTGSSRSSNASPLPTLNLRTELPHFSYTDLELATNYFNEDLFDQDAVNLQARKLGSGAFGTVYLGIGLVDGVKVAVKKLHLRVVKEINIDSAVTKQFKNEVELLSKYRHRNLTSLLGYSCDGPTFCLIYEYICKGALGERLVNDDNILPWIVRLNIANGVASGIAYLHSAYKTPLIHRDIKSANILLDADDEPKLCDFGLMKLSPNTNTYTATTVLGTSAYMASEAFRGDISIKMDTFSFGIVLLELLTGLPPLDDNREGADLLTHVQGICEDGLIKPLLDYRAGIWVQYDIDYSEKLFQIANSCLEYNKKKRPTMVEVSKALEELIHSLKNEVEND